MIVLGRDMHKSSRTIAAVAATTGDKTVEVGDRGLVAALGWARGLGAERVWRWRTAGPSLVPSRRYTRRARARQRAATEEGGP